ARSSEPSRVGAAARCAALPLTVPAGRWELPATLARDGSISLQGKGCPLLVIEFATKRLHTTEVTHGSVYRNRCALGKLHRCGDGTVRQEDPSTDRRHPGQGSDRSSERDRRKQVCVYRGGTARRMAGGGARASRERDRRRATEGAWWPQERCR